MLRLLCTVFFLFVFNLPCYAEIARFNNEFTGSKTIVSSIDRDKEIKYTQAPNNITLKKELLQNKISMTLILLTSVSSPPAILDNTNFKFNNANIVSLRTAVDPYSYSMFFELNDNFIKEALNATSLQIQIPMYSNNKNRIKYKEYDISPDVLNEWKQVIAME